MSRKRSTKGGGKRERMTGGREKRGKEEEKKGKGREGEREEEETVGIELHVEEGEGQCAWRNVTVDFKVQSHTLTYHKQHAVPSSPPPVPLPPSSTTPPTPHGCWAESQ